MTRRRRRLATTTGAFVVRRNLSGRNHTDVFGQLDWQEPTEAKAEGSSDGPFNLLDQLTMYGSYHNNPWNQLLHFVFVPVLVWTVAVWFAHSGPYFPNPLPEPYNWLLSVNLSFVFLALYAIYYVMLDPIAGLTWGLFVGLPLWVGGNAMWAFVEGGWKWAALTHVFAWYMQIHPGHIILEGRQPALLDSFFQSIVLAPLFVWFELLFLLGYRPGLREELSKKVEENIRDYREGLGKDKGGSGGGEEDDGGSIGRESDEQGEASVGRESDEQGEALSDMTEGEEAVCLTGESGDVISH
ncbi:hypothetical protein BSKO_13212 [Bryopsis sp. KO-2023]|nr:hypothetical protein BSKO_13212 [Bryopsis sp. KO-2023]